MTADMLFTLITVMTLLCLTTSSSFYLQPTTICVSTSHDDCSMMTSLTNCTSCHSLSYYIQNVSKHFTSNTTVIFASGTHCLQWPPGRERAVNMTGIYNFSMIGQGTVSWSSDRSDKGTPLPSSIISCNCGRKKSGFLFYRSNSIQIENLTIEDCGTKLTLQNSANNFTLVSALVFYESVDITLIQLRMNRNRGFGLHTNGVYGSMIISNSAFLRFIEGRTFGGNARFWYNSSCTNIYPNTTLTIRKSWFMHGVKKKYGKVITCGGLTILIFNQKVNVTIDNVKARNNTGNVVVRVQDCPWASTNVTSSIVINNSMIAKGKAKRGAGIRIAVKLKRIKVKSSSNSTGIYPSAGAWPSIRRNTSTVTVMNTTFNYNSAWEVGGGAYITYYEEINFGNILRYVNFFNCKFIGNSIYKYGKSSTGAAVQFFKHRIEDNRPHTSPQFFLKFSKCTFKRNAIKEATNDGGILDFVSTSGILIINSNFISNNGTAISLRESSVEFIGNIVFRNNRGMNGGALRLCQFSKMYLLVTSRGLHMNFINNSATSMGGAIYVAQEQCVETSPPCFFQPIIPRYVNFINDILQQMNLTLTFQNNTANLAGNAVYGGEVDNCYITARQGFIKSNTYLSHKIFNTIFNFSGQHNSSQSTIASTPYGVCFCNASNGTLDSLWCNNMTYPLVVSPGQTVSFGVTAIGQRNGTVPTSPVYFEFGNIKETSDNTTQLMFDNYQHLVQDRCNILNARVYSKEKNAAFNITMRQVSKKQLRHARYSPSHLLIQIGKCPWGFSLSGSPPYTCICDELFTNFSSKYVCDVDTAIISRPGGNFAGHMYWLGCNNSAFESSKHLQCRSVSLSDECPRHYCRSETVNISLETLDYQCATGREGVLCGRCKQNYSLALGTSRCLSNCSNFMAFVVLAVCAVSGVLLVVFLIACNLTVSEGTINGLLFYAHVVHRNSQSFFPGSTGFSNSNIFRLFIAWLNLDLGFEVCFYKSLTQYQKTWLQFCFLFYLWMLELVIIILSRRYIFFTRLVGRNVVKVLATLFLICYAKTISIAISSLEFASIRSSGLSVTKVWLFDGNVAYLYGKHIPLFLLGIVLIFISLAYTLTLLFIQCLQRRSNLYCLRWVDKLRPFFEAYTGPCQINYRFWPGFLFFVRLTLYTFSSILRGKPVIILNITTAACIVILIFAFVSPNGVYKQWPLNILESFFIINLGILSGLVMLFSHPHTESGNALYFVYPSISTVMVLFGCILSFHCVKQIISSRHCRKVRQLLSSVKKFKFRNVAGADNSEIIEAQDICRNCREPLIQGED